jgi:hypothetical protein
MDMYIVVKSLKKEEKNRKRNQKEMKYVEKRKKK